MTTSAELKRQKAKQLRYKKAIAKDLNLDSMKEWLWDVQEECEEVRWYFDGDDDSLINTLDGDSDEADEFKMLFADLCAECDKMREDLYDAYAPHFDDIVVAGGIGDFTEKLENHIANAFFLCYTYLVNKNQTTRNR